MAYVKQEFVLLKMKSANLPYYRVFDGTRLIDEMQDESVSLSDSMQQLTETLESLDGGTVIVKISEKTGKQKAEGGKGYGHYEYTVKLNGQHKTSEASGINGTVTKLYDEIASLRSQLIEKEYNAKLDALKRDMEDLKNNKTTPLEQFMPMIAGMFGVPVNMPPVSGAMAAPPAERSQEDRARLKAAINRLITADPQNHLEVLEMIAELAATKPSVYVGAIPMLKAQL